MLLEPAWHGLQSETDWIQFLAFSSLNTLKSFLFTPCQLSKLHCVQEFSLPSYQKYLFCVGLEPPGVLLACLRSSNSSITFGHCLPGFCWLFCLAAQLLALFRQPAPQEWGRHCSLPMWIDRDVRHWPGERSLTKRPSAKKFRKISLISCSGPEIRPCPHSPPLFQQP